ncbi:MAG: hypothetical protein PSU93_07630 [Methylobacter sp.]|uniref:Uncharacterized protein n=1 Tax=Candidatus Methylobacter titanis TaxID=3053457 RepID=A0AA43Q745_9GAMM|nr:hypothetical protein [Candidatus Methylobacter titanis]
MLFKSHKQEVIIIAENDASSATKITDELQSNNFYNLKFAVNGAEIHNIIRKYYQNPEAIGLIIVSENLPGCQIKDLCSATITLSGRRQLS